MSKMKITKEEFINAVESGMCAKDITRTYGITPNTVKAYCQKYGLRLTTGVQGRRKTVVIDDDEYIIAELKKERITILLPNILEHQGQRLIVT